MAHFYAVWDAYFGDLLWYFHFTENNLTDEDRPLFGWFLWKKKPKIDEICCCFISDFSLTNSEKDAIITSFLVPIIGIIISYLLRQNMVDFKRQKFIIQPVYCNQNLLNLVFSGIFEIKMIHIINIIYVLIKGRGKEWKNERTTSNRRAYGHSYE